MKETIIAHLNRTTDGTVYCEQLQDIVQVRPEQYDKHCQFCPYFDGFFQGQGVECSYPDSTAKKGEYLIYVDNPVSHMMKRYKAFKKEEELKHKKFVVSEKGG